MYTRRQKTQQDCDNDAAALKALIDTKVPGLFKVDANASAPRVECKGLGGIYCGWSNVTSSPESAWQHFYREH